MEAPSGFGALLFPTCSQVCPVAAILTVVVSTIGTNALREVRSTRMGRRSDAMFSVGRWKEILRCQPRPSRRQLRRTGADVDHHMATGLAKRIDANPFRMRKNDAGHRHPSRAVAIAEFRPHSRTGRNMADHTLLTIGPAEVPPTRRSGPALQAATDSSARGSKQRVHIGLPVALRDGIVAASCDEPRGCRWLVGRYEGRSDTDRAVVNAHPNVPCATSGHKATPC